MYKYFATLRPHFFRQHERGKKGKKARVGKVNKKDVCKRLDLLV